ncbi:DUF6090 family protein [Hyunsoonleella jejuensis]|nr:DUF6090 family protein [Hyunsoonleella jejuensis]
MMKFFRKIRQNLLSEGKTAKYFKYAIGEIILVMIGILLALQVNNWNNERLAEKQMRSFLHGIINDLKSDTLQFENRIQIFNNLKEHKKTLLQLSNFEEIDSDSLFMMIRPRIANYEINMTTFDKIKSLDITQISENDSLSTTVYNYYTVWTNSLINLMNWDNEESKEEAYYFYFNHNQFEISLEGYNFEDSNEIINFQEESIRKANLVKLLSEPTGRNHLKRDYTRKQIILNRLERFKDRATSLIADIEKELNK